MLLPCSSRISHRLGMFPAWGKAKLFIAEHISISEGLEDETIHDSLFSVLQRPQKTLIS